MKLRIVVPSSGRARTITTHRIIPGCVVVVPASQIGDYRTCNPGLNVIALDRDTPPGVNHARQWIYSRFPNVFMIDDDLGHVSIGNGMTARTIHGHEIIDVILNAASVTAEMGAKLFGFGESPNPRWFDPLQPLRLSGGVIGAAFGLLDSERKLFFAHDLPLGEDTFVSLLNAYYYRYAYYDRRVFFHTLEPFVRPGGCSAHRSLEKERKKVANLRRYFGTEVLRVRTAKGSKTRDDVTIRLPY